MFGILNQHTKLYIKCRMNYNTYLKMLIKICIRRFHGYLITSATCSSFPSSDGTFFEFGIFRLWPFPHLDVGRCDCHIQKA